MSCEDLEQPNVVLVELVQAELRDDDHAHDARPVTERHRQKRLLDRIGALDLPAELAVRGVRDHDRLAELGAPAGDALADVDPQEV